MIKKIVILITIIGSFASTSACQLMGKDDVNLFRGWRPQSNNLMELDLRDLGTGTFTANFLDDAGEGCTMTVAITGDGLTGIFDISDVQYFGTTGMGSTATCEYVLPRLESSFSGDYQVDQANKTLVVTVQRSSDSIAVWFDLSL